VIAREKVDFGPQRISGDSQEAQQAQFMTVLLLIGWTTAAC